MRAIIYERYGPPEVLKLKNVKKPTCGENEVLVKVHASTVTAGTIIARTAKHPDSKLFSVMSRLFFGLIKPRKTILGYELSGEIESVGKKVKRFKKGDQVFGTTTGLKAGAYAEYVCLPEEWKQGVVGRKPKNLTHEEAAAVPVGGMTALYLLKKANITKGQTVLVYGASGSVGTYAVQIARYYGAEVTGVCSGANLEMVRSIGAEQVIDYTKEDFTKNGKEYDIIFDAVMKTRSSKCKGSLTAGGAFISVGSPTSEAKENLEHLKKLCESGDIKPVIDRTYPLDQTARAHRYCDKGHKKGNVVITVVEDKKKKG